jgi:cyclopropane fatty-acyl-phospholipid synthase-like methyltransferase
MNVVTAGAEQVRRYYDDNTRLFLSLGQGSEGTIRRAVWGPGVQDRRQAMRYVDSQVLARLRGINDLAPGNRPRVADLGCGVGSSLCFIAEQLPISGTGITISPAQAELGTKRIAAQGLSDRVRCIQGNFCDLPTGLEPADLAFGIESFIHAPDASAFFEQASRLVRPGGYLMVCDDLLAEGARDIARARSLARRVRDGWKGLNLLPESEAHALARKVGFEPVETLDLTPFLEMQRPRDYAIGALMRCFGWLPVRGNYWAMLYGGHALQLSLKRGWMKYLLLTWQRR